VAAPVGVVETTTKMAVCWVEEEMRGAQLGKRRRTLGLGCVYCSCVNINSRWGWGGKTGLGLGLYHVEYWANTTHPEWGGGGLTLYYIGRIRIGVQVIQYKTI
jgi:hypothetical protein